MNKKLLLVEFALFVVVILGQYVTSLYLGTTTKGLTHVCIDTHLWLRNISELIFVYFTIIIFLRPAASQGCSKTPVQISIIMCFSVNFLDLLLYAFEGS